MSDYAATFRASEVDNGEVNVDNDEWEMIYFGNKGIPITLTPCTSPDNTKIHIGWEKYNKWGNNPFVGYVGDTYMPEITGDKFFGVWATRMIVRESPEWVSQDPFRGSMAWFRVDTSTADYSDSDMKNWTIGTVEWCIELPNDPKTYLERISWTFYVSQHELDDIGGTDYPTGVTSSITNSQWETNASFPRLPTKRLKGKFKLPYWFRSDGYSYDYNQQYLALTGVQPVSFIFRQGNALVRGNPPWWESSQSKGALLYNEESGALLFGQKAETEEELQKPI
jgi:hypothetical protein